MSCRAMVGAYVDRGYHQYPCPARRSAGDVNAEWIPHPGGLTYAEQLVRLVRDSVISMSGSPLSPKGHPQAIDLEAIPPIW
ncbi:putative methylenetetrahydrofolate reductase [Mycobacteroides abscessus MAB_091912_2446]|uniref:Putative methylenetetrahydrofolate reductase n=1 Tax=Mycobacteroides abscessus MAB_091912_2446 TaxID=1335414 RepID=A0A829M9G9_9MYCO|nr:putative methylenetetrahydrofolate reductase [Mycobacteroides abscessus MAB_091912_2446]